MAKKSEILSKMQNWNFKYNKAASSNSNQENTQNH